MRLAELQSRFQSSVLEGGGDIAGDIAAERAPPEARLAIYADAHRARLAQALADNYPKLSQWLGPESFRLLSGMYARRYPPKHFSIRWHGAQLSAFLADTPPYREHRELAELAHWEWRLALAFDAADNPVLRRAAFTSLTPEQWPGLRFTPHPSVSLITTQTDAPLVWRALDRGEALPEALSMRRRDWVIWRKALETRYRALDAAEAAALQALARGDSFGEVCAVLAEHVSPDTAPAAAAAMLACWLEDEMLDSSIR